MNAIHILRTMHADTRVRFKLILGADEPSSAARQWDERQPLLALHEDIDHKCLCGPIFGAMGHGTPLGDWEVWGPVRLEQTGQQVKAMKDGAQPATKLTAALRKR